MRDSDSGENENNAAIKIVPSLAEFTRLLQISPAGLEDGKWFVQAKENIWKHIVLHHSATQTGSKQAFDRIHKKKMPNGFAYHFLIGNGNGTGDGVIEIGDRWLKQLPGGHLRSEKNKPDNNLDSIGVVLVGDFTKTLPTEKQLSSLKGLVKYLSKTYAISAKNIYGHREMPNQKTVCPGDFFSVPVFVKNMTDERLF